jgi:broad specificity phosphatase PhoE
MKKWCFLLAICYHYLVFGLPVQDRKEEIRHIQLEDLKSFPGSDNNVIRIYIVRHGESALNVLHDGIKYVQGQSPSVPLTDKGIKQADALAQQMELRMKDLKPHLVTSTAKRAIDTARPLASRFQQTPSALAEFLELGSGKWEGINKKDPEYVNEYNKWQQLPSSEKFFAP